tara:strand:+ start:136 stop:948 length:813 start_codon:yes stop_codon:yes gene_type:complete
MTPKIAIVTTLLLAAANIKADDRLTSILAAQTDNVQARYQYRHPEETLRFFGIEPGMTVVEVLPGEVWYTKILKPYLGSKGKVIGADYNTAVYKGIGYDYASPEFLATRETWISDWIEKSRSTALTDEAEVDAFVLGALPGSMHGTADAVLFFRALHNLAYTAPNSANLKTAIKNSWDLLKSGGIVGVVQHHARDNMSDSWASGENGYLKKSYVVDMMQSAGFNLVAESNINANEKDRPTESEYVWRLPPDGDMKAIGESNRMTLKFIKP